MEELIVLKKEAIAHRDDIIRMVNECFTGFYKALFSGVNCLRQVAFSMVDDGRKRVQSCIRGKRRYSDSEKILAL